MMILLDMKMPESCSDCELRFCGICEQGLDKEPCPIIAEIPDGGTNGGIIETLFSGVCFVREWLDRKTYLLLSSSEWWNAPYEGIKNER